MLIFNVIGSKEDQRISGVIDNTNFNVTFSSDLAFDLKSFQEDLKSIENVEDYEAWVKSVGARLEAADTVDTVTKACNDLMLDVKTGNYFVTVDGKISKHPVPTPLVEVILESAEKDIDPTPIVKAWIRFLRNPHFSTKKANLFAQYITTIIVDTEEVEKLMEEDGYVYEKAVERAQYRDVTITEEGLIVAKKYARLLTQGWVINPETNEPELADLYQTTKTVDQFSGEVKETTKMPDFMDDLTFEPPVQGRYGNKFSCIDADGNEIEDHIIKVGMKHELKEWSMVNTNDDISCVPGLHVGGLQYVACYKGLNCQLLDCFVDPSDIGAICGMGNFANSDGAIRVKAYFIYKATTGRTKGIYHSSKYAAKQDEEWAVYKKEAIELANKFQAELVDFDVN